MDSLELNALPIHPTLLHPLTGQPLRAAGVLSSGRVVWPIMGGSGEGGDANDGGDPDGGNDPGNDPDPEADPKGGNDPDPEADPDADKDPRVQRANKQAAQYRTQLRNAEQALEAAKGSEKALEAIRKALDPKGGDEPADPKALATQITSQGDTIAQLQANLLVHELATEHKANPVALLDSNSFTKALHGLDPSDPAKHRDAVAKAIKDAVSKNAAYRIGQGSSRGGSELDPEARETKTRKPKGLGEAIGKALNG